MLLHSVFALEALDPARGIDQAMLTGIKRMTLRAHFDVYLGQCRTGLEGIAACASDNAAAIFGMNSGFHRCNYAFSTSPPRIPSRAHWHN